METYWVWEYWLFEKNPKRQDSPNPEMTLEVVKAADAQATIAALTQENERLKQGQAIGIKNNNDYREQVAALQARVKECDAVIEKQVAILEEINKLDAERAAFVVDLKAQLTQRTTELEAVKADTKNMLDVATSRLREQVADLQAELERVSLLSSHNERRFEEVDKKYKELRTLILALPKVEGEIMVSESLVLAEDPDMCSDMSDKDEAMAYAALLTRRQGMEG